MKKRHFFIKSLTTGMSEFFSLNLTACQIHLMMRLEQEPVRYYLDDRLFNVKKHID